MTNGTRSNIIAKLSSANLSSRFDDFLYANVGSQDGGTSVLSILARADVDPWRVAQQLADMSKPRAALHLASMIAGTRAGTPGFSQTELRTCIDRLPRPGLARGRIGVVRPISMGTLFIGLNGLFFILLCLSLMRPLPDRNVGSPRYVAENSSPHARMVPEHR